MWPCTRRIYVATHVRDRGLDKGPVPDMSTDAGRYGVGVRDYALEKQRAALANSGQSLFSFGRSVCHLRVIDRGSAGLMVFATDVDLNPGPSITNAVELLAREIRERVSKGVPFDLMLCHPEGDPLGTGKARYSSVTFETCCG